MSERERLENLLQAAGFAHRNGWGSGKWHREVDRPGGGCVDVVDLQDDGNASYTQVCAWSDLPALLSPSISLSLEEIRKAIMRAFDDWLQHLQPTTTLGDMRDFAGGVLAHLQQPTQTTAAPLSMERNAKEPEGFYLSVSPDALVLATRPDYVVGTAPPGVPPRCPVTGMEFFSIERNPDGRGWVPTYGGPFDSFTIPRSCTDGDARFECRRYDHDAGNWADGWEIVPEARVKI